MQIIEDLEKRGLIKDISDPELDSKLKSGDSFYAGFDPTAPSLHLGNFLLIMTMLRLVQAGLRPIMLFGGATGQVGDPSGKSEERPVISLGELERNMRAQQNQARNIFDRLGFDIKFVDNAEWTAPITVASFFREVGKYITVNYMLGKEVVKSRLDGDGLSYAEFSYMLIQANDFLHLYQNNNCKLQVGGSDQWGNLTCGLELIRKKVQGEAYAFSIPLLTDEAGKKFGKSEEGAIWLDPELTAPYKLHQYLLNVSDQEVMRLITQLTFATDDERKELEEQTEKSPEKRAAQQYLADSLCTLVHGEEATNNAKSAADVLFGGSPAGLPADQLLEIFSDVPSYEITMSDINGMSLIDLLDQSGACDSKGAARRLVDNGGAYLNNQKVENGKQNISESDLIDKEVLILRTGKKNYRLVKII